MINPRLKYWKPKKDGSVQEPDRPGDRLHILIEDRNGDHGLSYVDSGAGDGGNLPLAAAGPWVLARDDG